jgi:hypothetical protein
MKRIRETLFDFGPPQHCNPAADFRSEGRTRPARHTADAWWKMLGLALKPASPRECVQYGYEKFRKQKPSDSAC